MMTLFRDRPERVAVVALIPEQRRLAAQVGPFLVRITAFDVKIGVQNIDRIDRHSRYRFSPPKRA